MPRVDFVKIDVEGAELDVLAGAVETMARFRPKVIMEFNSYALVHIREIIPRRALADICRVFDDMYYFQDRTGYLIPLAKTESDLEMFLHNNLLNGCVDDLLCTFRGVKLGEVFPKRKSTQYLFGRGEAGKNTRQNNCKPPEEAHLTTTEPHFFAGEKNIGALILWTESYGWGEERR